MSVHGRAAAAPRGARGSFRRPPGPSRDIKRRAVAARSISSSTKPSISSSSSDNSNIGPGGKKWGPRPSRGRCGGPPRRNFAAKGGNRSTSFDDNKQQQKNLKQQHQPQQQQRQQQQQHRQQQQQQQQSGDSGDPESIQQEQLALQQHVFAALQQRHNKEASARRWERRRQQQQQQQEQRDAGAAKDRTDARSSSSSSSKAIPAAAPTFLVASTSEAARAAAAAADVLLKQEDVLQWLDTWGKGPWHSALKSVESAVAELPLPKGSSSGSSSSSDVDWAFWAAVGDTALQHVTNRFHALLQTDSEQRWLLKNAGLLQQQQQQRKRWRENNAAAAGEQQKGPTRADEVSSLALLTQQSPLCSSKCLLLLLRLAACKNRSAAHAAAAQLYELFVGPVLLPSFRKLRGMRQQPQWLQERVAALLPLLQQQLQQQQQQQQDGQQRKKKQQSPSSSRATAGLLLQVLLLWRFEETLAHRYSSFVTLLRGLADDSVSALSCRALKYGTQLLARKPQEEQQLLSLLVDKLGASKGKVASCASLQLALLLRRHRPMLPVVVAYTSEFVLQRLAAVLQQGRRQAADAFATLMAAYRRCKGRLPALFRYRHHELQQQQQQQQESSVPNKRHQPLSSRTTARARELQRLLLHAKSSSSSKKGQLGTAAVRVYDLLLPPKFAAGLQAVYRGLLFLSEMTFREEDGATVARLLGVYLSVFRRLRDFGVSLQSEVQEILSSSKTAAANKRQLPPLPPVYLAPCCNRLVRVMLAGLLRALPYVSPEAATTLLLQTPVQQQQQKQQKQQQQKQQQQQQGAFDQLSEVLFTLTHTLPSVSSRVLAMRILQSLTVLYHHSPDRLSRVVYEQLQQHNANLYAGRRAGLLLLLLQLLLQDTHDTRKAALLKRLLQTSLVHASPGVAAASLQVVELVLLRQPQLRLLLSETEKELQQTEETFEDLTDDEETPEASKARSTPAAATAASAADAVCVYLPEKRDPRFTRASETRLWEIAACSASYHPRVSSSASQLISAYSSSKPCSSSSSSSSSGSGASDAPAVDEAALVETLRSVTDTSLLDDLAYKGPQQQQQQQQEQQQEQQQRVSLNSSRYWQRHEAEPQREFIRRYFLDRVVAAGQMHRKGDRGAALEEGDSEAEGSEAADFEGDDAFSDEEVDAFLEKQARQLGGGDSEDDEDGSEGGEGDSLEGDSDDVSNADEEEGSLLGSEASEASEAEDPDNSDGGAEEALVASFAEEESGDEKNDKPHKRKRQKTPEDPRLRALKRQLQRRAIAGSAFTDAEGLEDLLD